MAWIQMLADVSCVGYFDYKKWEIVEVDDYWAERLTKRGVAKRVQDPEPQILPSPETKRKKKSSGG